MIRKMGPAMALTSARLVLVLVGSLLALRADALAAGPQDFQVAYRLDPWLISGNYGSGFWASPPVLGPAFRGIPFVVQARAQALDSVGAPITDSVWTSADPSMVQVSPGNGADVEISVARDGQTTVQVNAAGITKELVISAQFSGAQLLVQIAQQQPQVQVQEPASPQPQEAAEPQLAAQPQPEPREQEQEP
jgi:hypothetical protein